MKGRIPEGIISPLVTPFSPDERLDEDLLRKQISYLLENGVHGISPGGSTGEGAALTDDELARMVEICREETPTDYPVVAGVIRNSTRAAVNAGLAAKKAGATALMVTPISYNVLVPDDNGNIEFFKTVSEAVCLPIILYNVIPQNEISPELFLRLCELKYIDGIKQSVGDIRGFIDMMSAARDAGTVYTAIDDMLFFSFELGAYGAIAGILTLYPRECVDLWDAVQAGDTATAIKLQNFLYPRWKAIRGPQFPRRLKEALKQKGLDFGISLSPNLGATEAEKLAIAKVTGRTQGP